MQVQNIKILKCYNPKIYIKPRPNIFPRASLAYLKFLL